MTISVHASAAEANAAAAEVLGGWFGDPAVRTVMLAGGNTPLALYGLVAEMGLPLGRLRVFALDEYVGVPTDDPRNCANLIRRTAVEPWGIPDENYAAISSDPAQALASVRAHERLIEESGGLDAIVLGLGQNGHLGFNEPGSAENSAARLLDLESVSIAANRLWFGGDYAPAQGVTVGMKTILGARRVLVAAHGPHKTAAVAAMLEGPRTPTCPASLLQGHPCVHVLLDETAAAGLHRNGTR